RLFTRTQSTAIRLRSSRPIATTAAAPPTAATQPSLPPSPPHQPTLIKHTRNQQKKKKKKKKKKRRRRRRRRKYSVLPARVDRRPQQRHSAVWARRVRTTNCRSLAHEHHRSLHTRQLVERIEFGNE